MNHSHAVTECSIPIFGGDARMEMVCYEKGLLLRRICKWTIIKICSFQETIVFDFELVNLMIEVVEISFLICCCLFEVYQFMFL